MPLSTVRGRLLSALAFGLILVTISALASRCGGTAPTVRPGPAGSGTLTAEAPARVLIAGPSGAVLGSSEPAPVQAVLPSGRLVVVHPPGVTFPVGAVVAVPRPDSARGPVLIAVEGTRRAILPDFRRLSARVTAFDSLGRPLEGAERPVVTFQPRPPLQVQVTVRAGVERALGGSGETAAFVALSPLRVWGFRPDVALSVARDSAGFHPAASVGVSVDVLAALAVRGSYRVTGTRGPAVGVAFRF